MKTLILLSAIPGSGKSTWAKEYKESHKDTYIIASDEIRLELYGSVTNFTHEDVVWKTFLDRLNEVSSMDGDVTAIADATNLQNKYRKFYNVKTPGFDKHVLVLFNVPFDTCLKQNKMRTNDRVVPYKAMLSLQNEYEKPDEEVQSIYDEVIVIKDFVAKKR